MNTMKELGNKQLKIAEVEAPWWGLARAHIRELGVSPRKTVFWCYLEENQHYPQAGKCFSSWGDLFIYLFIIEFIGLTLVNKIVGLIIG